VKGLIYNFIIFIVILTVDHRQAATKDIRNHFQKKITEKNVGLKLYKNEKSNVFFNNLKFMFFSQF
jgi:hypothetical protein